MRAAKSERYAVYKDSGAAWMGEIPEHWKFVRVKDLILKITSGVTPRGGAESYVDVGVVFLRSQNVHNDGLRLDDVSYISENTHQEMINSQVKPGDIVFNITGASIARTCTIPETIKTANISQHIALLRPRKLNELKFISYYLQSQLVKDYVYLTQSGASKEAFNHGQMKCIPVSLPPRHEQTTIANYLDKKTAKIDRKIYLLGQKATQYGKLKQSLINETVTCGLDKSVPMKGSGVVWIGDVPVHWEIKRIKELFVESKSKSVTGDEDLLSVSEYSGVTLKQDSVGEDEFLTNAESLVGYKLCKKGDLVINIMLAWKRGLGVSPTSGIVSPSYAVYRPKKEINPAFLHYRLRNEDAIAEFKRNSTGIIESRLRLYSDSFYALSMAIPPLSEQNAIAKYLDEKTAQIDRIVTAINDQIDKLKNLRKALINDVVTGKIKVVSEGHAV